MKCPNCGEKLWAKDVRHSPEGDETYRLRYCEECGEVVYTSEFIIEKTDSFMELWRQYNGHVPRTKVPGLIRPRYTAAEIQYMTDHCNDDYLEVAKVLNRRSAQGVRCKMYQIKREMKKKEKEND